MEQLGHLGSNWAPNREISKCNSGATIVESGKRKQENSNYSEDETSLKTFHFHIFFSLQWWQIKWSRSIYICLTCTKNSRALLMVPRTTWVGHRGPPNSNNWLFKKGDIRTSCERVLSLFFESVTHWYLYRMNQSFHCCLFQCKVSLEIFEITFLEGVVLNKARNQVNVIVGGT